MKKIFFSIALFLAAVISTACNKCVTCTTTTTSTDLNDIPTGSENISFPICDNNERKYWDGRKTTESKGTYKMKTSTTCSK